jgi:hypothetical protein
MKKIPQIIDLRHGTKNIRKVTVVLAQHDRLKWLAGDPWQLKLLVLSELSGRFPKFRETVSGGTDIARRKHSRRPGEALLHQRNRMLL